MHHFPNSAFLNVKDFKLSDKLVVLKYGELFNLSIFEIPSGLICLTKLSF